VCLTKEQRMRKRKKCSDFSFSQVFKQRSHEKVDASAREKKIFNNQQI
jgi:hypothetical protein